MWLKSIGNKYPLYHIYIVKKIKQNKKQSYFTFYNEKDKEEKIKKLSHSKISIWLTLYSNYYSNQNHPHKQLTKRML